MRAIFVKIASLIGICLVTLVFAQDASRAATNTYLKALETKDKTEKHRFLLKTPNVMPQHVNARLRLAELYFEEGRYPETACPHR